MTPKTLALSLFLCFSCLTGLQAQQWGMYTLVAPMNGTTVTLIDTNNVVYHTWTFPTNKKTGYSTYLLPNGELLRTVAKGGNSFTGGPICGEVQKVAWDGTVTWDYIYSTTTYCSHHDIHPMPNGNVLLIAYESRTPAEATALGCTQSITMWPDKIVEVQPTGATTGTVVWEWTSWDHTMQNVDNTKSNYVSNLAQNPQLLNINYRTQKDWLHMNGVDYNDSLDQIAFTSHNMDEIYVIDHSTTTVEAAGHTGGNSGKGGDILYRWGNPAAYGASGSSIFDVVHDAHWVRRDCPTCPNANQLVAFDNNGISMNQSAVDFVLPTYSGYTYSYTPGSAFLPLSYNQRIGTLGHSSNMGGSQSMINGNTLITVALSGYVYEVNSAGSSIWSYTASGAVPKAFRYSSCYVTGAAGTPTITANGGTLTSSSGVTYQWYQDSILISGATSQTYSPTANGNYTVVVTDSEGCTSGMSLPYAYTGGTDVFGVYAEGAIRFYPNPTNGLLHIADNSGLNGNFLVRVTDLSGKSLLESVGANDLDLSALPAGTYSVSVVSAEKGIFTSRIVLTR